MMQHTNIDRQADVEVSPAPFTYTSTLTMAGIGIPAGSFLALKVYVGENAVMPYRFHSVQPDGKVMLCDARGVLVGYWQTYKETAPDTEYVSSVLVDMRGVLMGHIACTLQALNLIRRVVTSSLDTVFLDPNAFVLLPQCHTAILDGFGRSIGIQSQSDSMSYHTGDIDIVGQTSSDSCVWLTGGTVLSVSLTNTKATLDKRAGDNGLCELVVNGDTVNCVDKSILIKAETLSNLRVVMENNRIVLRGVLNA